MEGREEEGGGKEEKRRGEQRRVGKGRGGECRGEKKNIWNNLSVTDSS